MSTTVMSRAELQTRLVDAVLDAAAVVTDMELVALSEIDESTQRFHRLRGSMPGLSEGYATRLDRTMCGQMLAGAPRVTADAATVPQYAAIEAVRDFGVSSYAGTPIGSGDGVLGTLCGMDRGHVQPTEDAVDVLDHLGEVLSEHLTGTVVRRTATGWRVGGDDRASDLTSAMVLADLLASDLSAPPRPARPSGDLDHTARLELAVTQLEHALRARVTTEQAIGVLAERFRLTPRPAFDLMRTSARSRGIRVHDLAARVVASVTDPSVELPDGLSGPRR